MVATAPHDCSSVELNHLTAIQLGNWDAVVLLSYAAAGPEKAHVASGHSATALAAELLAGVNHRALRASPVLDDQLSAGRATVLEVELVVLGRERNHGQTLSHELVGQRAVRLPHLIVLLDGTHLEAHGVDGHLRGVSHQ